jgi:hypothetical protein
MVPVRPRGESSAVPGGGSRPTDTPPSQSCPPSQQHPSTAIRRHVPSMVRRPDLSRHRHRAHRWRAAMPNIRPTPSLAARSLIQQHCTNPQTPLNPRRDRLPKSSQLLDGKHVTGTGARAQVRSKCDKQRAFEPRIAQIGAQRQAEPPPKAAKVAQKRPSASCRAIGDFGPPPWRRTRPPEKTGLRGRMSGGAGGARGVRDAL